MDQQQQRGRSPSAGQQQPHIQSQSHSPSPGSFDAAGNNSTGLGIGLDQSAQQPFSSAGDPNLDAFNSNNNFFDPSASFNQQLPGSGPDPSLSFASQSQPDYLSPSLSDQDFSLFPPAVSQGEHFTPLFEQSTMNPNDINNMTSPGSHTSPTPPHLLQPDATLAGSAQHSPSFNTQQQFPSPTTGGHHSRNASHTSHASLGPEAALLPNQLGGDWSQPQFQGHRRSPSAHSDVSSVSPSPNLVSSDSFDDPSGHSPLQRPSDGHLYQEVLGIGNFSISDPAVNSPGHTGRSPSHSPALSPRVMPQQVPDMGQQQGYALGPQSAGFGGMPNYPGVQVNESFPSLSQQGGDLSQMAPPSINIDYAPTNNSSRMGGFDNGKQLDVDSLTPPERGKSFFAVIARMQLDYSY